MRPWSHGSPPRLHHHLQPRWRWRLVPQPAVPLQLPELREPVEVEAPEPRRAAWWVWRQGWIAVAEPSPRRPDPLVAQGPPGPCHLSNASECCGCGLLKLVLRVRCLHLHLRLLALLVKW